jgi:hypothetical protein
LILREWAYAYAYKISKERDAELAAAPLQLASGGSSRFVNQTALFLPLLRRSMPSTYQRLSQFIRKGERIARNNTKQSRSTGQVGYGVASWMRLCSVRWRLQQRACQTQRLSQLLVAHWF